GPSESARYVSLWHGQHIMTQRIFIDTGAFLALEDESDQYHDSALQFREQVLRSSSHELITISQPF
ncbi:MAG: hypothetical protein ACP5E9_11005, partial [Candidatus Methanospirareceae archaeon]